MPLVDVTELLTDPDIAGQGFTVLRRQEVVNAFGESTVVTQNIPDLFGSIQPAGENTVMREDSFDAQPKTIKIVTAYRLRGVAVGPSATRYKPDQILWNGNLYEVSSVNGWSQFGAGFVEAEANAINYVDLPPSELIPRWGRLDFSNTANSALAHGAGAP